MNLGSQKQFLKISAKQALSHFVHLAIKNLNEKGHVRTISDLIGFICLEDDFEKRAFLLVKVLPIRWWIKQQI